MSDNLKWVKARASGSSGGNCAEVAALPDRTRLVRDSKNPNGPRLTLTPHQWRAFVAGVRNRAFDLDESGQLP